MRTSRNIPVGFDGDEIVEITAYSGPPINTPYARKAEEELTEKMAEYREWEARMIKKIANREILNDGFNE